MAVKLRPKEDDESFFVFIHIHLFESSCKLLSFFSHNSTFNERKRKQRLTRKRKKHDGQHFNLENSSKQWIFLVVRSSPPEK